MNIIGIIPARMSSSRFPGKPLKLILSMPMIGHVYHRARMCQNLTDVYVGTCDKEIYDYISSIGGKPVMTKDTHERATERTSEAFEKIMDAEGNDYGGVLMIHTNNNCISCKILFKKVQ